MPIKCQSFSQILETQITTASMYGWGNNSSHRTNFRGASDYMSDDAVKIFYGK